MVAVGADLELGSDVAEPGWRLAPSANVLFRGPMACPLAPLLLSLEVSLVLDAISHVGELGTQFQQLNAFATLRLESGQLLAGFPDEFGLAHRV